MVTREQLLTIMNTANNSPEKANMQDHFSNICLYSKLAAEVGSPDFPMADEPHTPEQMAILKEAANSVRVARQSLMAIDEFCMKNNLAPITDVDLRRPEIFKIYADFINKTIESL